MEDGRGWMARLVPVRDELLRGNLRSLYIGWVAGVAGEIISGRRYEEACSKLVDIAEAYALFATNKQFQNELKKFMAPVTCDERR
jgi:hypothetical protein